jgi:hypothetical protein
MLKYIYQTLRFFRNAFSRNISPIFSVFVENVSNGTARGKKDYSAWAISSAIISACFSTVSVASFCISGG